MNKRTVFGLLAASFASLPAGGWAAPPTTGRAAQRLPPAPTPVAPTPSGGARPATPAPAPNLQVTSVDDGDGVLEASDAQPATFSDLADRMRDTEARLEQMRGVLLGRQPRVTVGGYVDFGFFATQGNGSGIIRDDANALFPRYKGQYGWVFLGDLLAPTVNSRGEAADLGDAAGAQRYDGIHSGGAPGFIVNEVNLLLTSSLGEGLLATASVNFVPRTGSNFSLGDFLDVDLAQLEWMPTRSQKTSIFVGKFDSVLGIEYRDRKASQRFGITPSLIARYTTGTALGLKVRSKWGPEDMVVLAAAVTNGSNTTEQFHFYNEIDTNAAKTASGRLSIHPPIPVDVEVGVSGSYGAQDRAPDSKGAMWFLGADLQLHIKTVDVKAQYLRGASPGATASGSMDTDLYALKLHGGGYAEVDWMVTPLFGVLGRGEFRDALVWQGDPSAAQGANRLYITKEWRATGGIRLAFSDRVIVKAEYLHNGEYGGIPQIKDDVFTTSLVLIN
ncbi:MAG TPA: hypothetical protein VH374_06310 [Polyangia bacterium]|jgi:hypothetical protein|nr:hypothetical protein [Polyangia bacterium]